MVLQSKYREIARATLTSKAIFFVLSQRERNRKNMNLARLRVEVRHVLHVPLRDSEFMATFKELEHAGAGKIHYGVRGAAKYFSWDVPITETAKLSGMTEEEFKRAQAGLQQNKSYSIPRIVGGKRIEQPINTMQQAIKSHIVFVFPDGDIKKLDVSSDISDSMLTELAKIFMKDSYPKQKESMINERTDKSDVSNVSNQ